MFYLKTVMKDRFSGNYFYRIKFKNSSHNVEELSCYEGFLVRYRKKCN